MPQKCRSCGAAIEWLKTASGKNMPVDTSSIQIGDRMYNPERHVSHFATCPQASKWRRKENERSIENR